MTKKSGGLVMALAVAVGLATSPLAAQRGQGGMVRDPGPNMGRSLEAILENQEKLELTGEQVRELEGLKATIDKDVAPLAEEMKALREQIWNGDLDRREGYRQMQELRGNLMVASAPLQGRIQEILTVEQHRKIQLVMRQERMGAGGGGAAFQGRGGAAFRGRGGMAYLGRVGMAFHGRGGMAFQGRRGFNGRGMVPMGGGGMGLAPGARGFGPDNLPDSLPRFRRGGIGDPQGNLSSPQR